MTPEAAEKHLKSVLYEFGLRFKNSERIGGVFPTLSMPSLGIIVFISERRPKKELVLDKGLRRSGWVVIRLTKKEVEKKPRLIAGYIATVVRAAEALATGEPVASA
jgi:very-short-patch-repair endonuclease